MNNIQDDRMIVLCEYRMKKQTLRDAIGMGENLGGRSAHIGTYNLTLPHVE